MSQFDCNKQKYRDVPTKPQPERTSHDLGVSMVQLLTEILREVSHVRATLDVLVTLYEREHRKGL
jgi:hypothetical protein